MRGGSRAPLTSNTARAAAVGRFRSIASDDSSWRTVRSRAMQRSRAIQRSRAMQRSRAAQTQPAALGDLGKATGRAHGRIASFTMAACDPQPPRTGGAPRGFP